MTATFVAACPYCQRATTLAEESFGATVTCKQCRADFVAIPSIDAEVEETPAPVATIEVPIASERPTVEALGSLDPTVSLSNPSIAGESTRIDPAELGDPAFVPSLITIAIAALGILAWLIPGYGRLVWLGVAIVSLLAAGFVHLAVDRLRTWAWCATGAAGASLFLCIALPWLLGEGWWPDRGFDADKPSVVTSDGEMVVAEKDIDLKRGDWVLDGLRVALIEVKAGTVDMIPTAAKPGNWKPKQDMALMVTIEVSNDGSLRILSQQAWNEATAKFAKATDEAIPFKTFEAGWKPQGQASPSGPLNVGQKSRQTLYLPASVADPGQSAVLTLDLQPWGVAGIEPIRGLVPLSDYRKTNPRGPQP